MSRKEYPRWVYTPTGSYIVHSEDEMNAIDGEYFHTPEELADHVAEQKRQDEANAREQTRQQHELIDKDDKLNDLLSRNKVTYPDTHPQTDEEVGKPIKQEQDLETLRATARDLGLTVHHKTGADKLEVMIKEAIEKKGE